MKEIIGLSDMIELVDKHFGSVLKNLGYTFSQSRIEGERYFIFDFTYTSPTRNIKIEIRNDYELINYKLICNVIIHRLPHPEKYENRLYPEYFHHIQNQQTVDYEKYKIDRSKDVRQELDRVINNYAKLLFNGNLFKVVKGDLWYENIHVPRD